jgi:hypothetical protein
MILPGMPWGLGHDDYNRSIYRGPEHQRCNRSSAATRGNKMRGKTKQRVRVRKVIANPEQGLVTRAKKRRKEAGSLLEGAEMTAESASCRPPLKRVIA